MSSFIGKCAWCRQAVTYTDNTPGGHFVALDPATGGKHACQGDGHSNEEIRHASVFVTGRTARDLSEGWTWHVDGAPFTYPTACWVCKKHVFAHSNGFGDFVLFDFPLGPPWTVHDCYLNRHLTKIAPERSLFVQDVTWNGSEQDAWRILWARQPHPGNPGCDIAQIRLRGENRKILIDYWRLAGRVARQVWLLIDVTGREIVIPVEPEPSPVIVALLQPLASSLRLAQSTTPDQHKTALEGTIIGSEEVPGYIISNFDKQRFRLGLYGERPRLHWLLCNRDLIVPVLARKTYSNQLPGTRWHVSGLWENLGLIDVLFVTMLQ